MHVRLRDSFFTCGPKGMPPDLAMEAKIEGRWVWIGAYGHYGLEPNKTYPVEKEDDGTYIITPEYRFWLEEPYFEFVEFI